MAASERYGTVAILFHWSIAVLIVLAFALGLTVDLFPESWKGAVINTHSLIGLAVLLLSIFRLSWRRIHPIPEFSEAVGPSVRITAKVAHAALYVLMILVPLIGIPTLLFRGRGLDFGFLQIASPFEKSKEIFGPLTEFHQFAAYALIGLAVAHILAAVYHHRVLKDDTMRRMSPWVP
jgi:cytochrome b561